MISIKHLSASFEIGLLNILIDLLTDSRLFQSMIRWVYQTGVPALLKLQSAFNPTLAIRWSLAGLGIGFLMGLLFSQL